MSLHFSENKMNIEALKWLSEFSCLLNKYFLDEYFLRMGVSAGYALLMFNFVDC